MFITALAVVLLFSVLFSKNNLAVGSGISRTYGSNSQFPFHSSSICSFHTSQNVLKRVGVFFPVVCISFILQSELILLYSYPICPTFFTGVVI